jgi:hypothetical protein
MSNRAIQTTRDTLERRGVRYSVTKSRVGEGEGSPLCHVTFFQVFDSPLGQFLAGKTSISEQMIQFFEK